MSKNNTNKPSRGVTRVYVQNDSIEKCPNCGIKLEKHTATVSKKDYIEYCFCEKCRRRFVTVEEYCTKNRYYSCLNPDVASPWIEKYRAAHTNNGRMINPKVRLPEGNIELVKAITRSLKLVDYNVAKSIDELESLDSRIARSVIVAILAKGTTGEYRLFLITSGQSFDKKSSFITVIDSQKSIGRNLIENVKSVGKEFYCDGRYTAVNITITNKEKYEQCVGVMPDLQRYIESMKALQDSRNKSSDFNGSTIVYVYFRLNNKCISQKHQVESVTAETYNVKNGRPIEVNVYHCIDCDRFFINYEALKSYTDRGIYPALDYYLVDFGLDSLNKASKLMVYGYNVRQGDLTAGERRKILSWLIDSGLMSKAEIISDLQFKINYNGKKRANENAKKRWQEDIDYVSHYTMDNTQRIKPKFVFKEDSR